ncbi:MAG: hypothetical protein AVDCRST_MAG93-2882, partial [uncultured Chloroflexia bacterium]
GLSSNFPEGLRTNRHLHIFTDSPGGTLSTFSVEAPEVVV